MSWRDRDYGRGRQPADDDADRSDSVGDREDDAAEYDAGYEDADGPPDRNAPDPADLRDGDEPAFVRCPNCRRQVADDAEQCPRCGHYLIDDEIATASRPPWVWVGIGLALLVAAGWAIFG